MTVTVGPISPSASRGDRHERGARFQDHRVSGRRAGHDLSRQRTGSRLSSRCRDISGHHCNLAVQAGERGSSCRLLARAPGNIGRIRASNLCRFQRNDPRYPATASVPLPRAQRRGLSSSSRECRSCTKYSASRSATKYPSSPSSARRTAATACNRLKKLGFPLRVQSSSTQSAGPAGRHCPNGNAGLEGGGPRGTAGREAYHRMGIVAGCSK